MYTYADVILITIKKEKCLTTSVFRKTLTMYYFHVYFFALILMKRPFSFFFLSRNRLSIENKHFERII